MKGKSWGGEIRSVLWRKVQTFSSFSPAVLDNQCLTFAILGFVITDCVIIQRLTDFIWVGLDSVLNETHIKQVARIFYASGQVWRNLGPFTRT